MRVLVQRVSSASVIADGTPTGSIGSGLLVLVGFEEPDTFEDIEWICGKLIRLRIFNDENGVMNLSLADTGGDILVVSQFTLHASTRKGNRPSYIRAARPEQAVPLYENFLEQLEKELGKPVAKGVFGADMQVNLVNNGPVTLFIDSRNRE